MGKLFKAWCYDCTEGIETKNMTEQMAWWSWHSAQEHDGYASIGAV